MVEKNTTLEPWNQETPRRRFRRWAVDLPAFLLVAGRRLACRVFDVSPGGARIQLREGETPPAGSELELAIEGFGRIPCEVRHGSAGVIGLMFLHDEAGEMAFARFLIELRPDRPQVRRQLHLAASLHLYSAELPCTVTNLSSSGVALSLAEPRELAIGDRVDLELPGYGLVPATIRYVEDISVGLALIEGLDLSRINTGSAAPGEGNSISDKVIRRLHKNAGTTAAGED